MVKPSIYLTYVSVLGEKLLYVKNIEDMVEVTTQIKILDICNEHQDILDYIDDNTLIKEFWQGNNFRRHFISIT